MDGFADAAAAALGWADVVADDEPDELEQPARASSATAAEAARIVGRALFGIGPG
jgi:hypothetical protein